MRALFRRGASSEARRAASEGRREPARSAGPERQKMKIAVCIKQVVTREWQLRVNDQKTWIRDQDASFELNEPDAYALEEALRLKEKHGGEVIVCSARLSATIVVGSSVNSAQNLRPSLSRMNTWISVMASVPILLAVGGRGATFSPVDVFAVVLATGSHLMALAMHRAI